MKERITQCNILYESWQMQCCGDPIHTGQVVNLPCIKKEKYICACGIAIDYDEEHHGGGADCLMRGKVTKIKAVFVDKFANVNDGTRYVNDPENTFAIIDVHYIDGWEDPVNYAQRKAGDACYYIITLQDAIECVLESHDQYPLYNGLFVKMEPDEDSNNLFWNEGGSEIGTLDCLSIFKDERSETIDLTSFRWHKDLVSWYEFYRYNVKNGYDNVSNVEWLKWWSKGWELAKEVRKLLPSEIELAYGYKSQTQQVLDKNGLNTESFLISFPKHMQNRIDEGAYIPKAYVDWELDNDEDYNYRFRLDGTEHDLHEKDKVMLGVCGRPQFQIGTVLTCKQDSIVIHTDWALDISEAYSIELIL